MEKKYFVRLSDCPKRNVNSVMRLSGSLAVPVYVLVRTCLHAIAVGGEAPAARS